MKVERIKTYDKFVQTKMEWNTLLSRSGQNRPFLTHQWFDAWWQSFGHDSLLEILFFRDEAGSLSGIAPTMVSDAAFRFMASHEVTDYCDFISLMEKRDEFYESLSGHFQSNFSKYSSMEFINIPASSPTLSSFRGLAARYDWYYEANESEISPVLILPKSYEKFMRNLGRKNRHELRRKNRKLESLGHIRIEQVTESEKLGIAVESFISLHKASTSAKKEFWQKQGMPEFFHELARLLFSENWVELHTLHVGKRLIAALLNFSYADTVYFYNVAYNREYSVYSPGFYLFDQAIKQAIARGKKVADFLRGREKYKYFFGAKESKIYSLKLKHKKDTP